jgi:hypothetical protein
MKYILTTQMPRFIYRSSFSSKMAKSKDSEIWKPNYCINLYFLPKKMPGCGKDTVMKSYDFMMRPGFDNILETFVHQAAP